MQLVEEGLTHREIQALEVTCFVQATEDPVKLRGAIEGGLDIQQLPEEEVLEGHFGNGIVRLRWHLTGDEAWRSFHTLMTLLGRDGRNQLLGDLEACLDEHGAMYVRLSKQSMMGGMAEFSSSDPIRIKVKPRSFMMGGPPAQFYERVVEGAGE
jgi:RNA binding exosome subunit